MNEYQKIYTLSLDIISSTKIINSQSNKFRDDFYESLSGVFIEDLMSYGLEKAIIKFTGDGILISVTPDKLTNLLYFSIKTQNKFSEQFNKLLNEDTINWGVRIGISGGNDIVKEIFGKLDVIGDSVRRAVRMCSLCQTNQILTSGVYQDAFRDFSFVSISKETLLKSFELANHYEPKIEEDVIECYILEDFKIHSIKNSEYVYRLNRELGRREEANSLVDNIITQSELLNKIDNQNEYLSLLAEVENSNDKRNIKILDKIRVEKNISKNIIYFNKKLNHVRNFKEGERVIGMMKSEGQSPDVVSFNTLLNKAESFKEGERVIGMMKSEGQSPDVVSFNTLLNKAESFKEGERVIELMDSAGILPNVVSYTTLLNKAESFKEGERVIELMDSAGILPDVVSYTTLLSKAESFKEGERVIELMDSTDILPDVVSFNTLLSKAESFKEGERVIELMDSAGILPDVVSFNTLLSKAESFKEGERVIELMDSAGILPDVVSFNTLLSKTESFKEGERVIELMDSTDILPDVVSFNTLLNKAESFKEGERVIELMDSAGILPDVVSFNTLLNKAESFKEGERVIELMDSAGILPNVVSYTTLLNKAESFKEGERVIELMDSTGILPNVVSYTTLLSKAESFKEGERVIELMDSAGILPNVVSFNTLLSKVENISDLENFFKLLRDGGVFIDELSMKEVLRSVKSGEQAINILLKLKNDYKTTPVNLLGKVFKKELTDISIDKIINFIFVEFENKIQLGDISPLIRNLYEAGRIDDCFRLILYYPYLDISIKILKTHGLNAINKLTKFEDEPNFKEYISSAVGICFYLQKKYREALDEFLVAINNPKGYTHNKYIVEAIKTCESKLKTGDK